MKLWKHIYEPKVELLIFGYINTDFLIEGDWGKKKTGFLVNDV